MADPYDFNSIGVKVTLLGWQRGWSYRWRPRAEGVLLAPPEDSMSDSPHKCSEAAAGWIWLSNGEWIFDTDNGLRGPVIRFCPFCGERL